FSHLFVAFLAGTIHHTHDILVNSLRIAGLDKVAPEPHLHFGLFVHHLGAQRRYVDQAIFHHLRVMMLIGLFVHHLGA
ncbi:hypothetical protein ACJX0J_022055, partial [Zea mays]